MIAADNFIFSQKTNKDFNLLFQQEFPALAANREFMEDLRKFVHTVPKLPSSNKVFSPSPHVTISSSQSRDEIIKVLSSLRNHSVTADLAFYAGRQMDSCDWKPFLKAAFERNPVSVDYFREMELDQVYLVLSCWPDESIYEGNGLAMPDEVVNYRRGEGIEKAITFINIAKSRHLDIIREQQDKKIILKIRNRKFKFPITNKPIFPSGTE